MAIATAIELNDNFTGVMYQVNNSVSAGITAMENLQQTMNTPVNSSSLDAVNSSAVQATAAINEMNASMNSQGAANVQPQLMSEASVQQIGQIKQQMQGLEQMQQVINEVGKNLYVLPEGADKILKEVNSEIERMKAALDYVEQNPFQLDDSTAQLQIQGLGNSIEEVTAKQQELNTMMGNLPNQVVNMNVEPVVPKPLVENPEPIRPEIQPNAPPEPVTVPVQWQTDGMEVFTGTGIERFQQEVQSANNMLSQLSSTQDSIAKQAFNTNIFPPEAVRDLTSLSVRIDAVRARIQQIENNKVNIGTDIANSQLEQLRSQLNSAIQEQNNLNQAMQNMDVSQANASYLRLSQAVSSTETYIRDNVNEQGQFNQKIQEGTQQANGLTDMIKNAAMAYVSIQSVGKVLNMSDELSQSIARLNTMNDGLQSTDELVNMVYAAAQDARGSFADMAMLVSRLGNNAGDAFGSSEEVVAFADLVQKQMTIAGASTQEASGAILQLSQALGSGVLRGDELNSIFDQAPNLIQNIADYMDVPIGQIREMAKDGEISADIVKAAIFAAADDINSRFEQMPITFGQIWQSFKDTALIVFQPVLQIISDIANSEAFEAFVKSATEAMATLSNIVLNIFDLVGTVGNFIADNWSVISPIVYGIAAALAVYYGWQLLCAAASGIMHIAQLALNAVMMANPVMLVVLGIIALIAVIFAVCSAIAKMTGVANSGFGVIMGCIFTVGALFKNLGLGVANIALGIGNAIAAVASNIMTAFHNAICSVQAWWYDLLSTVLTVVAGICEALNKLPFVEFDYSGITSAADDYAAKAAEAAGNKEDYTSISDAFNEGMSTFDTFQNGWVSDAFDAGAALGDGIADKISNFSLSDVLGKTEIPDKDKYTAGFEDAITNAGIGSNLNDIADDTGKMKDSMDITEEDLKYLRDIAEQEAINKFTTAEITIEQTNHNNVSSTMDLDGIVNGLTDAVNEAVDIIVEGVHS